MQAFFESFTTWVTLILQLLVIAMFVLGMGMAAWFFVDLFFFS